jgi:AcrR family transcriptional regulator
MNRTVATKKVAPDPRLATPRRVVPPLGSAAVRTRAGSAQPADDERPAPRTQVERRTEAEARLLATARQLIARRGWAGTTLADVGEAAGYSRGLAGHYFGSKAGLLRAITEQINNSMMEEVRKAPPAQAGLGAILAFVGVYLGRKDPEWTNTRSLLNLMTHALLEGSEHADLMVNFNVSMFKYVEDNIRAGIQRGEIDKSISPPVAAEFVIGTLRGMMLQRLVKGGDVQATSLRKHVQVLIERALRADK